MQWMLNTIFSKTQILYTKIYIVCNHMLKNMCQYFESPKLMIRLYLHYLLLHLFLIPMIPTTSSLIWIYSR